MAGFVYLIADTTEPSRVKIGKTIRHPMDRLRSFQTGSPVELELQSWWNVPDEHEAEKRAHELFAGNRVRGEWFKVNRHDAEHKLNKLYSAEEFRIRPMRVTYPGAKPYQHLQYKMGKLSRIQLLWFAVCLLWIPILVYGFMRGASKENPNYAGPDRNLKWSDAVVIVPLPAEDAPPTALIPQPGPAKPLDWVYSIPDEFEFEAFRTLRGNCMEPLPYRMDVVEQIGCHKFFYENPRALSYSMRQDTADWTRERISVPPWEWPYLE